MFKIFYIAYLSKCFSTEVCAISLPSYICSEAHCMMALFIRYWVVNIRTTESPYFFISLSIKLTDRPLDAALWKI